MQKTREQIVEDLIDHAKILGKGNTEDWQFIENIKSMGSALLEMDETDSECLDRYLCDDSPDHLNDDGYNWILNHGFDELETEAEKAELIREYIKLQDRKISRSDKEDLLMYLDLPIGSYFLPEDYDPKRSSCYDFKAEVEEAYGVKAGLAGIQGDHFCLIWLKPPEDYTYPSGIKSEDEVCYYVQPAWDKPSQDNEWKGEWYLEIHPQEEN